MLCLLVVGADWLIKMVDTRYRGELSLIEPGVHTCWAVSSHPYYTPQHLYSVHGDRGRVCTLWAVTASPTQTSLLFSNGPKAFVFYQEGAL